MTTHTAPLTHRIHVDTSLLQRFLCGIRLHDWARWELLTYLLKEGRQTREIAVNVRECIGCGLAQRRLL